MSLSSLSDDVTKYLRLGDLYRIEVYLSQSSGGWEVQEHGTEEVCEGLLLVASQGKMCRERGEERGGEGRKKKEGEEEKERKNKEGAEFSFIRSLLPCDKGINSFLRAESTCPQHLLLGPISLDGEDVSSTFKS
jgi:hypothetical protein